MTQQAFQKYGASSGMFGVEDDSASAPVIFADDDELDDELDDLDVDNVDNFGEVFNSEIDAVLEDPLVLAMLRHYKGSSMSVTALQDLAEQIALSSEKFLSAWERTGCKHLIKAVIRRAHYRASRDPRMGEVS